MCIVCYVIPVALHLKLYLSKSGYQLLEAAESPSLAEPLLQVLLPHSSRAQGTAILHWAGDVSLPGSIARRPEDVRQCLTELIFQAWPLNVPRGV